MIDTCCPKNRRMRCGRLDPSLLGESLDQLPRTSASPTAWRAHINFLQFACNVPIATDGMSLSRHNVRDLCLCASDRIQALPCAGHAYSGEKCREQVENGLLQERLD